MNRAFQEKKMDEQATLFFTETREAFQFLEHQYDYQQLEGFVRGASDGRDATVVNRYVGSRIGIEISWYFAGSNIGVAFVELQQPNVFQEDRSFYPLARPNVPKAISLYSLAEMLNKHDDPDFLLKNTQNTRQRNRRAKFIDTNLHAILVGLAHATQTYATDILKGDTTIFSKVMDYELAKQKRLDPNLFIPGLKQQDEQYQQ